MSIIHKLHLSPIISSSAIAPFFGCPNGDGSMLHALIRQKVKDFDEWKKIFDADDKQRKSAGSMGGHVFRSMDDPNEAFVLIEYNDLDKAKKFFQSDELKQTMKMAGVVGKPDMYMLNEGTRFKV
jgi:heme-degrading monooxygenase HmoA